MSINDPFPGDWYAGADRPSSPAAWKIGREIDSTAARIRAHRPLHPSAIALLAGYDRLGYLDMYGGVDGVVDISEAAHFLTLSFDALALIFTMVDGVKR